MFCGLPVMVAVEPMLAAVTSPTRYGTGLRRSAAVSSNTSGVKTSTMVSLRNSADSTPDAATTKLEAVLPEGPERPWFRERLLPLLDYVETWNSRLMLGDGNRRAAELAHAHGLPGAAVSDAHTLLEVGVSYTIVDGPLDSAANLRAGLVGAHIVTSHGSRLVRLATPLAKLVQRLRGNRRVPMA